MKRLMASVIILVVCVFSVKGQELSNLYWLEGDWISKSESAVVTESWSVRNDSTLVGSGLTTENDQVTFEEALMIEQRMDSIRYIAILPKKTGIFGLEKVSKTGFSVIDPQNDFPSRIVYKKTKTGMSVTLEGKGNKQAMDFVRKKQ